MNLRTLKKLSKRAAPLLPLLGDRREQFRAAHARTGDNYTHVGRACDRKHWRRSYCHPTYEGIGDDRIFFTRKGEKRVMCRPWHPRKGTMMVGGVSGYYEPEWEEETAWEALDTLVRGHFFEWDEHAETGRLSRPLRGPGDVFTAAWDIINGNRKTAA